MKLNSNTMLGDYWNWTIEQRLEMEASKSTKQLAKLTNEEMLQDYYEIADSISFLEQIRTYQINDILSRMNASKYKLF